MVDGTVTPFKSQAGPAAAKPVDPMLNLELGVTTLLPFAAWYDAQDKNATTIGNDPKAVPIDNLVDMRKHDGQARALIRLLTLPIRAALKDAEWTEPEGGGEKEAEFANLMWTLPPSMGGMSVTSSKLLRQILLALCDGYAVFEEVRYVPDEGPLAGLITLRKMAYRDSRTIKFRVDETGGFNGVRQITTVPGGRTVDVVIPRDKVTYYAANEEENPFYGVSMFEAAYYHYEIKKKLYYIAHIAAQFAAVPGRVGEFPSSATWQEIEQFKKALASFAFNTSMVHKQDWKVSDFRSNNQFDFLKLIDHHNTMMAASVLAKFLQQEDRQVLIDNGKSDASADMFVMAIETIMSEIANVWSNYTMPKYIDWNFGTKKYPVFQFGVLTDSARDAIKEIFDTVVIAGTLNCTPEFVRQLEEKLAARLGLDIDYAQIAKAEQEQAASEAKAQQAQAEQQAQQQQAALEAQQQAAAAAATPTPPSTSGGSSSGDSGGGGSPSQQPVATSGIQLDLDALLAATAQAVLAKEAVDADQLPLGDEA